MQLWIFIVLANFIWAFGNIPEVPYEELTPGSVCTINHKDFKEYRYHEQIPYCRRNVSKGLKRRVYDAYGIKENCRKNYTIDHFVPLSIGGDNESANLWPEHKEIKKSRKNLEFETFLDLKNGVITQAEAIDIIYEAKLNPHLPEDWQDQHKCNNVYPYLKISNVD